MSAATIVIGPYGSPSRAVRRWHTDRASLVVRMLAREGVSAIAVHRLVDAGDYGDDAVPEERERGLRISGELAAPFPRAFVLTRDDGTLSEGTGRDIDAWMDASTPGIVRTSVPHLWSSLGGRMTAAGLGDAWARLAVHPLAVGPWHRFCGGEWRDSACGQFSLAHVSEIARRDRNGWEVWTRENQDDPCASGPETGHAGRVAADAALRALGAPEPVDSWTTEGVRDAE